MTPAGCDRIADFSHAEGDRILLPFDANSANGFPPNDDFTFIGAAAFSRTAGELRYEQGKFNTFIQGDFDGDGAADFWIRLNGHHTLVADDFVL